MPDLLDALPAAAALVALLGAVVALTLASAVALSVVNGRADARGGRGPLLKFANAAYGVVLTLLVGAVVVTSTVAGVAAMQR